MQDPKATGKRMALCHPDRPYRAKDKCEYCYKKSLRESSAKTMARFKRKRALADKRRRRREKENPELTLRRENARLIKAYGISVAARETLIASQGGVCAVCLVSEPVCVDHCHSTGKVRGILCHNCNVGIGKLKDDPAVVSRAVQYLEAHRLLTWADVL